MFKKILLSVCLLLVSGVSFANEPTPLSWGGVALLAASNDVCKLAPHYMLLKNDKEFAAALESRLSAALEQSLRERTDLKLLTGEKRMIDAADDSFVLFMAITADYVNSEFHEDFLVEYYNIETMVFVINVSQDESKRRLVTSVPVRIRFQNATQGKFTTGLPLDARLQIFRNLFLNPASMASSGEGSVPDLIVEWSNQASKIKLREKLSFLRVERTTLSDEAMSTLAEGSAAQAGSAVIPARYASKEGCQGPFELSVQQQIPLRAASVMEGRLSALLDMPVIPLASNAFEGAKQQLIQGNKTINITPPNPDISVAMTVDSYRVTELEENGLLYKGFSSRVKFSVIDVTVDNQVVFDAILGVSRMNPPSTVRMSNSEQLANLTQIIGREAADAFGSNNHKWFSDNRSSQEQRKPKDLKKQLDTAWKRFAPKG
jgi:hypothetical protein